MDTQTDKPAIDPLRRVFIPVERVMQNGTIVFRTQDSTVYVRAKEGGPMLRAVPKIRGKKARAHDKQQRRALRRVTQREP